MKNPFRIIPYRIAGLYLLIAGLWILFSDRILAWLVTDPKTLTLIQTYKGLGFVLTTGLILFVDIRHRLMVLRKEMDERVRAQEALQESEARYRNLVDYSPYAIFVDHDDRVVLVNQACLRLFGAKQEDELLGMPVFWLFHPEYHEMIRQQSRDMYESGKLVPTIEEKIVRLDGRVVDVDVSAAPFPFGGVNAIHIILRDITPRRRAELAVRKHNEQITALYNLSMQMRKADSSTALIPFVLDETVRLLNADSGMIGLLSSDKNSFIVVASTGYCEAEIGQHVSAVQGLFNRIIESGNSYFTTDYALENAEFGIGMEQQKGPAAIVLLRSEVEELGVMAIFRQNKPEVIPFDPSEQHLLSTIGELAGNALRRLLLFERAELRLHQTQALRKIDLAITSNLDLQSVLEVALDQIVAQLGVDAAVVLMVNHETQWLVCAAHRGFLSEKVVPEACSLDGTYTPVVGDRSIIHFSHWDENGTTNHRLAFVAGEKFVEYWAIPLVIKDEVIGILELFNRSGMNVDEEWIEFFNTLTGQVAIAIDNIELFNHLQQANISLEQAYDSTIEGWSRALDLRDRETEGHTLRVTELAIKLAQMVGMEKEEIVHLRRGALLHDMGKLAIPDSILLKPGKLTDEEWEIMRKHSTFACDMLANIEYLRPALDVPCHHHEKWDGSGYPEGLKGEEIPLAARVFAVADVWDALCSDRPYRPAWKREDVLEYIRSVSGTHFDPAVVDAFFEFLRTTD